MDVDALRKAGRAVEKKLKELVKRGLHGSFAELAAWLEAFEDAKPAFPANISVDHIAAHYSPPLSDERPIEGKLVKVDIGAHVDGWIADAAITFPAQGFESFARASLACLERAIEVIKPGISLEKVGETVWRTAKEFNLRPISNLGGHQIDRYTLHAGLFVPNIPESRGIVEEGMILAIEPFVTDGKGYVKEGSQAFIFIQTGRRARSPLGKSALAHIERYEGLPFAQRWLEKELGPSASIALFELQKLGSIRAYPVLREACGGLVSQTETTVIVDKDGAIPIVDTLSLQEALI